MAQELVLQHDQIALEREHKRKSTRITIAVHVVLLILAFFYTCKHEKAADNQYSVAINFEEIIPPEPEKLEDFTESSNSTKSSADEGAKRKDADKPEPIEQVEQTPLETTKPEVKLPKPTPTPPTPTEPVISETVTEEESEIEAVDEVIDVEEIDLEPVPDPAPAPDPIPDPEPAPPKAEKSTKDRIGSILDKFKKGGSDSSDKPDGDPSREGGTTGSGKGSKGDGKGASTGNDGDEGKGTGGTGTGKYDGSGRGVFGRKVISRGNVLRAVAFGNQEGKKIVAKICINAAGKVGFVELLENETTAIIPQGKSGIKKVMAEFYKYKYESDPSAPQEQCGKLTFTIQNINALHGG